MQSSAPLVRSDFLRTHRRFVETFARDSGVGSGVGELLLELFRIPRLVAVADAELAIEEVIALARLETAGARTALIEGAEAGLVDLFSPNVMIDEVEKHLPRIASTSRLSPAAVQAGWRRLARVIHFCPVTRADVPRGMDELARRDPKDLPYTAVFRRVGAHVILSADAHFRATPLPVLRPGEIRFALREYARARAEELMVKVGGPVALAGTAYGVLRGGVALAGAISRLPVWAQAILAGLSIAAVAHPTSRAWLDERLGDARELLSILGEVLGEVVEQGLERGVDAESQLQRLEKLVPHLSKRRRITQAIYGLVARAGAPLDEHSLVADLVSEGFPAGDMLNERAAYHLRRSKRFQETPDGWILRGVVWAHADDSE